MKKPYSFVMLLTLLLFACNTNKSQENKNIDSSIAKLDSLKGEFKPGYFRDSANGHIAIKVSYNNNQFVLSPTSQSVFRPGHIPFLKGDTSKDFVVMYRNENGAITGQYSFNNPALLRACEGEKPGFGEVANVDFYILVPFSRNNTNVELRIKNKEAFRLTVPPVKNTSRDTTINIQ